MQVKFTLNVTEVLTADSGQPVDITDQHYVQALERLKSEWVDTEHELAGDHVRIYFEMEDIDQVCDICNTYPCRCE